MDNKKKDLIIIVIQAIIATSSVMAGIASLIQALK